MIFRELPFAGAYAIDIEPKGDERGFFAHTWSAREFAARGLNTRIAECYTSLNARRGTLRGMHYQLPPHAQAKLVRATRGAIFDAIIDLRPDSATYRGWTSIVLSADAGTMLYVPEGFAHGYQTLEDDTEVFYQVSEFYTPAAEQGIRWDDPAFGIAWPPAERVISPKDRAYPDFAP